MKDEFPDNTTMATKPRVLIYCQHVLGMGHLIRSMAVARALRNCTVVFVNGGESISGLDIPSWVTIVNLPPISSDSEFQRLDIHGESTTLEQVQQTRKHMLFELFGDFRPDVVIIELFPFGRKRFAFELLPLLAHIRLSASSTKVVCSLRDILVTKPDPTRHEDWVVSLMNRYFDLVLIHSDPTFQTLDETFSRCQDLRFAVQYTGFVTQDSDMSADVQTTDGQPASHGVPLILASVGGGRVGYELLDSTVRASALLIPTVPHRTLLFTGPCQLQPLCFSARLASSSCHRSTILALNSGQSWATTIRLSRLPCWPENTYSTDGRPAVGFSTNCGKAITPFSASVSMVLLTLSRRELTSSAISRHNCVYKFAL